MHPNQKRTIQSTKKLLYRICLIFPIVVSILFLTTPFSDSSSTNETASESQSQLLLQSRYASDPFNVQGVHKSVPPLFLEIDGGCGPHYEGVCAQVRSGPGTEYPAIVKLRNGVVLKTDQVLTINGATWYRIVVDEWIRYPDRLPTAMYLSSTFVSPFSNVGVVAQESALPESSKKIIIDLSDQMLYAYDGENLYMKELVSTGIELTPTPQGHFRVYRKTPTRYMQGPIPGVSEKSFDLPGVPWNLYFTGEGAVIHGAYWHDAFGKSWSNGCVNLPPKKAKRLYQWADIGTHVYVQE